MDLSVVIPVFNLEDMLETCMESIVSQSLRPVEVIIVDNNSTDGSRDISRMLADKYPELIRFAETTEQGAPYARNCGLALATGSWILFLDGDDLLGENQLEEQLAHHDADTGFIVSPVWKRKADGSQTTVPLHDSPWVGLCIGGGALGLTSSILWNTMAVRQVGGWDVSLSNTQEYDLMFRILKAGWKHKRALNTAAIHLQRTGQISSSPYSLRLIPILKLQTQIVRHLLETSCASRAETVKCLRCYIRKYTHLRDKNPGYVRTFQKEFLNPTITGQVRRRFPIIVVLMMESNLLSAYRSIKRSIISILTRRTG